MKYSKYMLLCCFFITILLVVFMTCSETSVEPEPEYTVTISPEGGEYTFPDGISLSVPAGAVTGNTDITLRKISSDQLTSMFNRRGVPIENLLVCIEGTPDGLEFNFPVQVHVSVNLEPGTIPFVHEVDLENGEYTPAETEVICDPEQDSLTISLSHFSEVSVENIKEFDEDTECETNSCRCGKIRVEQNDKDYICNTGTCQITETRVSVTFLDCPGEPVEESFMREVSDKCKPKLDLFAWSITVPVGGQTHISAKIQLGCEPTEGQSVDFSISGPASIYPTYGTTNSIGEAYSTFTAGDEEGTAIVTARATVSYYSYTISANAGGIEETYNGPLITHELNESVQIEIIDTGIWSGTITWEIFLGNIPIQEYAKYHIDFQFTVSEQIDSTLRRINGVAIATQEVNLSIGDPCYYYKDLDAPFTLDLTILGAVKNDTVLNILDLTKTDYSLFYEYVTCYICDPPTWCAGPSTDVHAVIVGSALGEEYFLPLRVGTYSYTNIEDPEEYIIYTITLQR